MARAGQLTLKAPISVLAVQKFEAAPSRFSKGGDFRPELTPPLVVSAPLLVFARSPTPGRARRTHINDSCSSATAPARMGLFF